MAIIGETMTTLIGNEVHSYLDFLIGKINTENSNVQEGSNTSLVYTQLIDILEAEKILLKRLNGENGTPMLALTDAGMPSIDTLRSDLESMCSISEDHLLFSRIKQRFTPQIKQRFDTNPYVNISTDDFIKRASVYEVELGRTEIKFGISGLDNGHLNIVVTAEEYVKGYDKFSAQIPFFFRQGELSVGLKFNKPICEVKSQYFMYSSNKEAEYYKKLTEDKNQIHFERINDRDDFEIDIPWAWKFVNWLPSDEKKLVMSGKNARLALIASLTTYLPKFMNGPYYVTEHSITNVATFDNYKKDDSGHYKKQCIIIKKQGNVAATIESIPLNITDRKKMLGYTRVSLFNLDNNNSIESVERYLTNLNFKRQM